MVFNARCSPSPSGHSGCCPAGWCCQVDGVQASLMDVQRNGQVALLTGWVHPSTVRRRSTPCGASPHPVLGRPHVLGWVWPGRATAGSPSPSGATRPFELIRSDGEDALGVVAQADDGPADEPAGGLGRDAELLTDLAEALALAVEEPEARFDRVAGPVVERAEQLVEQVAVDHRHDVVLRRAVAVGHEVAERGVAVVTD